MKPSEESLNMDTETVAAVSPGARLSQARSQRGLTVEQVARETNLSPRYVKALDTDDYDTLPGAAFIRGYIRRYAQLVQLPPDELVADFDAAWRARAPVAAPLSDPRVMVTRGPIKVTSLGQAGKDLLGQGAARISVARILSWGSLALLLLLLVGTLFWNGDDSSTGEVDANDPMTLDMDSDVTADAPAEPVVPPAPVAPPVDAAAVPPAPVAPAVDPAVPAAMTPAAPVAPAQPVVSVTPAPVALKTLPGGTVVIPVAPVAAAAAPTTRPAPAALAPTAKPAPAAVAPVVTVPVISRPLTPGGQVSAPTAKPATTVPVTTLPAAPVRTGSAPAPATVVPVTPAAAAPAPTIDSLTFGFSGKSWISVRDATGQELVYGLKNSGQSVTVTGQAPFSINIGNVNVTTLTRNGRVVSLKPYTRGEIASFRLAR